ncbi:MAG TPA: hypothetical protein VFE24_02045, partial [Pirellulales bacterium]|nr:hypothetical protein [Pirellulales bacterium]
MNLGITSYFSELVEHLGASWNRFWFAPRDPAALCGLRACVGALGFAWYWLLGQDFKYLFGANGILPSGTETAPGAWSFSWFDLASDPTAMSILYWAGLAIFACLAVGFLSRVMSVLALALTLGVLHPMAMLISPFETVLVILLLYLCLAPTGAAFSVDRWMRRNRPAVTSSYAATIATRLLQIHLVAIYAIMVLAKLRVPLWWTGLAVEWMSGKTDTRLVNVDEWPEYVLNAWTHAIVLFEATFPILIWNRLAR